MAVVLVVGKVPGGSSPGQSPGQSPPPGHQSLTETGPGSLSPGISGVSDPLDGRSRAGLTINPPQTNADHHCEWYFKFSPNDAGFSGPRIIDISDGVAQVDNPRLVGTAAKDFDIIQLACHKVRPSDLRLSDL